MSASQNFKRSLAAAAALSAVTIGGLVAAASPAEAASSRWCSASTDRSTAMATCHGSKAQFYVRATCQPYVLWWKSGPSYTKNGPSVKEPHSSLVVCNNGDKAVSASGVWKS